MRSFSKYSHVLHLLKLGSSIVLALALANILMPFAAFAGEPSDNSTVTVFTTAGDQKYQDQRDIVAVPSTKAKATAGTTISVSTGKYEDIQAALDKGRDATKAAPLTVKVTKNATLEHPLYIYSNTTLVLENGATIKRGKDFAKESPDFTAMVYGGGVNFGKGYNHVQNIKITGGVWDAGGSTSENTQILSLRHGQNITVENATFSNATNHMINISASKDVTIANVTFKDAKKHTTASTASGFWAGSNPKNAESVELRFAGVEAIHTDFDTTVGEPGDTPHDGMPAGNIVIKNCIFDNVLGGVGTHHTIAENNAGKAKGDPDAKKFSGTSLTVIGCTFKNVAYRCVNAYSMDNVSVSGSKVSGTLTANTYFLFASDSKNIKLSDTIGAVYLSEGSTGSISKAHLQSSGPNAISVDTKSTLTINDTAIKNAGACGLRVNGGSNVTMTNSTITESKGTGISVDGGSTVKLDKNKVTNAGKLGLGVDAKSTVTATNNIITTPKENGIWVANSSKATLKNNTIDMAGTTGLSIASAASGTVVESNTVKNSKKWGILALGTQGLTINKNQVLQSTENGISVSSSPNAKVTNNTSSSKINVKTKREIYIGAGSNGAMVTGNIYGPRGISIDSSVRSVTNSNNKPEGSSATVVTTNKKIWYRLWGQTQFDTMREIVNEGWATSQTVVIATAGGFEDALSASGIAGLENAPVLLVNKNSVPGQTTTLLKKLKPKKVIIAGGTGAISKKVADSIRATTGVSPKRIFGQTATDTAAELNRAYAKQWSGGVAILATNKSYYDALSAAPVAYAKHYPIFLSEGKEDVSARTISAMKACGIKQVIVVGGTGAIKDKVVTKLKNNGITLSVRLWGQTQYDTSEKIASWAIKNNMSANYMGVATGASYYDALCGAALCGKSNAVLVLTEKTKAKNTSIAKNNKFSISKAYVFGGAKGAISDSVMKAFENATK